MGGCRQDVHLQQISPPLTPKQLHNNSHKKNFRNIHPLTFRKLATARKPLNSSFLPGASSHLPTSAKV